MEINMLNVYFASLVMCVVIGCIPFVIRRELEITKEKKRKFLFICAVVGVIPILNFLFWIIMCLIWFVGVISAIVKVAYEAIKQNPQE